MNIRDYKMFGFVRNHILSRYQLSGGQSKRIKISA